MRAILMPIHDWTRVEAGTFHALHFFWVAALTNALNSGGLPRGYYALVERDNLDKPEKRRLAESSLYALLADRIVIRTSQHQRVAIIEIVSPGTKSRRQLLHAFVEKAVEQISNGIHLLVIDLFPPSEFDRQGIHKAIWDEFNEESVELPNDKRLTLVSYAASSQPTAYVQPCAVGDALTEMPLFLTPDHYVLIPLEATYQKAWDALPNEVKEPFDAND